MKINHKELWVFLGCVATVVVTHTELLGHISEASKDLVMLVALAIIGMNSKVVENKSIAETKEADKNE